MEQNPASPSGGNIGELLAARETDTALDARTHSCHRRLDVQAPAYGGMRERDRMSRQGPAPYLRLGETLQLTTEVYADPAPIAAVQYGKL